jgi:CBS domain-containing protein
MTHGTIVTDRLDTALGTVGAAMERGVLTVPEDAPATEAAVELARAGVAGAPVVREGRVVGVVSAADLYEKTGHTHAQTHGPFLRAERHLAGFRVADLMTRDPVVVRPTAPLAEAVLAMDEADVNRLPVVDQYDRPIGILARDDVLRALARAIRGGHAVPRIAPG